MEKVEDQFDNKFSEQGTWVPRWYYILKNKTTGKKYFGQTVRKSMDKYCGSGKYWKNHCSVHGGHSRDNIEVLQQIWITEKNVAEKFLIDFEKNNPNYFDRSCLNWANTIKENTDSSPFSGMSFLERSNAGKKGSATTHIAKDPFTGKSLHASNMGKIANGKGAASVHSKKDPDTGKSLHAIKMGRIGGKKQSFSHLSSIGKKGAESIHSIKDKNTGKSIVATKAGNTMHANNRDPITGKSRIGIQLSKKGSADMKLKKIFCDVFNISDKGKGFCKINKEDFTKWKNENI